MKKNICLLLTLVLVFTVLLTGCSKKVETSLVGTSTEMYAKITAINGQTFTVDVIFSSQGDENPDSRPEMPTGDINNGNPPEMQTGDIPQGNPPDMPNGDESQGGSLDIVSGGENQDNPLDIVSGDGGMITPPELQTGDMPQDNPPDIPTGDNNFVNPPEMQTGDGTGVMPQTFESGTITIKDSSILFKNENDSEVAASLSDATVGKIMIITFDSKGNISKIVISDEADFFIGDKNRNPDNKGFDPNGLDTSMPFGEETIADENILPPDEE